MKDYWIYILGVVLGIALVVGGLCAVWNICEKYKVECPYCTAWEVGGKARTE